MNDETLECYGRSEIDDVDYWVYVLSTRTRWYVEDYDALKRKAEKRIGREPHWLRMAWEADKQFYVGQTENIEKRLGQHFKNKHSSDFTDIFEPVEIVVLRPAHTRNHAERLEESTAKSYYDSDTVYAYWN